MTKVVRLPKRDQVKPENTWDLSSLYPNDQAWEVDFKKLDKLIAGYEKFRGKLGESAKTLAACLKFDSDFDRLGERLGTYAFLKTTEDQANSTLPGMSGRFQNLATRAVAGGQLHPAGDPGDSRREDGAVSGGEGAAAVSPGAGADPPLSSRTRSATAKKSCWRCRARWPRRRARRSASCSTPT